MQPNPRRRQPGSASGAACSAPAPAAASNGSRRSALRAHGRSGQVGSVGCAGPVGSAGPSGRRASVGRPGRRRIDSRRRRRSARSAARRGSGSSLRRRFLMCESIARSYVSKATPWSASSSCDRVKIRPGRAASVASSSNSVGVRSTAVPATSARIRGTSRTTSPARIVVGRPRRPLGPAQDRPDARDELARAERLGQVVVGAELEPEQLVELVVAGREHHDRDRRVAAQLAGDVEAVEAGQAEVEDDQVGLALADRRQAPTGRRWRSARRSPRARGSRGRAGRSSVRRRRRGWSSSVAIVERRMRPRTTMSGGAWEGGGRQPVRRCRSAGSGRSAGRSSAPSSPWAWRCQFVEVLVGAVSQAPWPRRRRRGPSP